MKRDENKSVLFKFRQQLKGIIMLLYREFVKKKKCFVVSLETDRSVKRREIERNRKRASL